MNTYEIEHNILKELPQYYKLKELETAIGEEMRYKEFSERFIECQIDQLYALLTKEGFLKDDRLTLKGDMACLINEFHRLVFIDVYNFTSGFKSYTSAELFALLSCFCDLKSDVYMPKDDLLTYIHTRLTYYEDLESTLYGNTAYRLNYCMYEPIKQWLACDDEASCLQCLQAFIATTDLSIGDFVKGCLKIIHMSQELGSVCEFTKDYVCLEKIKQGKQSLLKFIMNNQSLYV
jgi:hypothetical protein